MNKELKACPFCGGKAESQELAIAGGKKTIIVWCGAVLCAASEANTGVGYWNQRSPANMCDTSSKLGDEIDALGRLKKRLEEHDHGSWNPVEIETMNTMVGGFLELVEDEIESLKRLSGKGITPDVEGLRKKTERALWKSYYDGPMETEHPIDLMDAIRVIGELFGDLPVAEPKGLTPEEVMDMYLEAAIEVREYERGDFKARFLDQSHAAIFKAKIKSRLSQTKEEDDSKN